MSLYKNLKYILLSSLLVLSLSACSKDEPKSPENFGTNETTVVESTSETKDSGDKFSMEENFGGRYDTEEETKSSEEIAEEQKKEAESLGARLEEIEKEKREVLGQTESNTKSVLEDTYVDSNNKEYSLEQLEELNNGLLISMRDQIYNGEIVQEDIDTVSIFIDENFGTESEEIQSAIEDYINDCWKDYSAMQESLANLPPEETWSAEELAENPDLKNFSRSEFEYIQNIGEQNGIYTVDDISKLED